MTVCARALAFAAALTIAGGAHAADIVYEPPIVEAPPVYEVPVEHDDFGGWYIRGDIDYHLSQFRGGTYVTYGTPGGLGAFDFGRLGGAFSAGVGAGYQMNKYLRADVTADYFL